ncbi:MAG: hypothetical protein U5L96_11955 [Owenweeksia sp.]|nr:hypothetical protein [Owenweeksia sp.]
MGDLKKYWPWLLLIFGGLWFVIDVSVNPNLEQWVQISQIVAALAAAVAVIIAFAQLEKKNDELSEQNKILKSSVTIQQQAFIASHKPEIYLAEPINLVSNRLTYILEGSDSEASTVFVPITVKGSPIKNVELIEEDNFMAKTSFMYVHDDFLYPNSGLILIVEPKRKKIWPSSAIVRIRYRDLAETLWEQVLSCVDNQDLKIDTPSLVPYETNRPLSNPWFFVIMMFDSAIFLKFLTRLLASPVPLSLIRFNIGWVV